MNNLSARPKAVVLVSGGLDSMLTIRILQELGIEVHPVNFSIGFGISATRKVLRPQLPNNSGIDMMRARGIDILDVDVSEDYYREVLLHPRHGYGSAINPCIDCKIFMLKKAWAMAQEIGAQFVATGEVVGQRPMSQRRPMLLKIVDEAGIPGKVLRPLSAKILPVTDAEREGLIDREKLYGIEGRSRMKQFELAKTLGLDRYENPAGGCLLTDPDIAARAWEMFRNEPKQGIGFHEFETIKAGTHIRIAPNAKLVIGRNFYDNVYLKDHIAKLEREAFGLDAEDVPGPFAILFGTDLRPHLGEACRAVARYADRRTNVPVRVVDKSLAFIEERVCDGFAPEEIAKRTIMKENARGK